MDSLVRIKVCWLSSKSDLQIVLQADDPIGCSRASMLVPPPLQDSSAHASQTDSHGMYRITVLGNANGEHEFSSAIAEWRGSLSPRWESLVCMPLSQVPADTSSLRLEVCGKRRSGADETASYSSGGFAVVSLPPCSPEGCVRDRVATQGESGGVEIELLVRWVQDADNPPPGAIEILSRMVLEESKNDNSLLVDSGGEDDNGDPGDSWLLEEVREPLSQLAGPNWAGVFGRRDEP